MITKNEKFKKECKLINLKYEYEGYIGKEQWAVVTDLTDAELMEKYSEELKPYEPFIKLNAEQGEAIAAFNRNEDKFRKRRKNHESYYGDEENLTALVHSEVVIPDFTEKQALEEYEEARQIKKMKLLNIALSSLTEKQYKYLILRFIHKKSAREIAREEGISHQVIDRHINAAIKKFEKVFKDFYRK